MEIHILDVGCGSMNLIITPDNKVIFFDCNITDSNEDDILNYVNKVIGRYTEIDVFINSHRDSDHFRGIRKLHNQHNILKIEDNGVPGTTTDSSEYLDYMALRREVNNSIEKPRTCINYGNAKLRYLNSHWEDYSDIHDQSIVLKIEYKGNSVMLTGDCSYRPWKEKILNNYSDSDLKSSILIASHHGSITFFDDPSDKVNYFVDHIEKIKPDMTLVSVGPNPYDLPDNKAIEFYEQYSTGSNKGNKVYLTEEKGNMRIILKEEGGWSLSVNQK